MNLIALCDNDEMDLQFLAALVRKYLAVHPELGVELRAFGSSAALKETLDAGADYCLFLLDILMPGLDGIEIGELIREKNETTPIIYTTSSGEYALSAFQNHALRYLVKPVQQTELFSALDFAFSLIGTGGGKSYTVKTREGLVCLPEKRSSWWRTNFALLCIPSAAARPSKASASAAPLRKLSLRSRTIRISRGRTSRTTSICATSMFCSPASLLWTTAGKYPSAGASALR